MFKKVLDFIKRIIYNYLYEPLDFDCRGFEMNDKTVKKYTCGNCEQVNTITGPICTCEACGQVTIFETKLMEHLAIAPPNICRDGVTASIDTWGLTAQVDNMDDESLFDEIIDLQLHAVFPPSFYQIIKKFKETGFWTQEERRAMEGSYILFYTSLVFGEEQ